MADVVARIEHKIDGFVQEVQDVRGDLADHESRLRTLERGRWPLPTLGILAGLVGAATGAVALFFH